jgi:hypothetical protein
MQLPLAAPVGDTVPPKSAPRPASTQPHGKSCPGTAPWQSLHTKENRPMTYHGQDNATPDRVRRYLKENYSDPDGTPLSDARLTELLTDHASIVERGIDHLSYAYYVGDQIAEAAGLDWSGDDSDDSHDDRR